MKLNKFLTVGCLAALYHIAPASAATHEDFDLSNPACTIALNDSTSTRFINVNYIRVIQVLNNQKNNDDKNMDKVLHISTASNYGQSGDAYNFDITYPSREQALQALNELRDKINDCQYDAAARRAARKKQ
jgi:predicted transcriptional regulator